MLASIHPLGERGRGQRYATTTAGYVLGAATGGAAMGASLGLLGSGGAALIGPSDMQVAGLAVVAASGALILEHRAGDSRLFSWHRQVNEDWMTTYRGWVYGAGFGFQLGLGFVTIITSGTVYLTFAMAFLTGSWRGGLLVGIVFGLTRASVALAVARVTHPDQLRSAHRQLQRLAAPAQRVAHDAQAAVVIIFGLAVMM